MSSDRAERSLLLGDDAALVTNRALVEKLCAEVDAQTVLGTLAIRTTSFDHEAVTVETEVDSRLFQHAGIVHGGIYVLMAESVASMAAALVVDVTRFRVSGMEINANHLRSVTSGTLRAVARPLHRGQTSHVYATEVTDAQGRLVSTGRCTMAVRAIPQD